MTNTQPISTKMPSLTSFVRERFPDNELSPVEIDRRAREVWNDIADETGSRTAHAHKVARLYAVCRDIQRARQGGARAVTTHKIVALLMLVLARSYGIGAGAR